MFEFYSRLSPAHALGLCGLLAVTVISTAMLVANLNAPPPEPFDPLQYCLTSTSTKAESDACTELARTYRSLQTSRDS